MRLSSPIYKLKRQARSLARDHHIKLHEALKQIAVKEGFKDWSHLASTYSKTAPAKEIMEASGATLREVGATGDDVLQLPDPQIQSGDLV